MLTQFYVLTVVRLLFILFGIAITFNSHEKSFQSGIQRNSIYFELHDCIRNNALTLTSSFFGVKVNCALRKKETRLKHSFESMYRIILEMQSTAIQTLRLLVVLG